MNLINLKQIIRNLARRRYYTIINILGLGIGLGCAILMATYIIHEFSFDKYHKNSENIYRVVDGKDCATYYAMGEAFRREIPEVKSVCRMMSIPDIKIKKELQYTDEKEILFSDTTFVELFDLKLVIGNSKNQLKAPDELLISEKIAKKYFPDENPVGQVMEMAISQKIFPFKISGVFENLPTNSSLQADFIGNIDASFSLLWDIVYAVGAKKEKKNKDYRQLWERNEFTTFLDLYPNTNIERVEKKCSEICLKYRKENENGDIRLQNLSKMYLHSNDLENTSPFTTNQLSSLKIFMGIGALILLVAILNFIMISNADNRLSIKEIACRKVNGASKKQILNYTLLKTSFVAFISLIPALFFVQLVFPIFNTLFEKQLSISLFFQWKYIAALVLITLLTGISAGFYLGFYISGIQPASLLQKSIFKNGKSSNFKGSLVVVQFIVFILLASSFAIMYKQYKYSLNKDMGLKTSNIIAIDINEEKVKEKVDYLKNELLSNPNVTDCRPTSFTVPPSNAFLEFNLNHKETGYSTKIETLVFGQGVLEMLQIPVIDGRAFKESDEVFGSNFIINEAAAKKYNVKAGEKIGGAFNVVGIVKNFHFHSLHQPVDPVLIAHQSENYSYLLIKTNGNNQKVIEYCRRLFQDVSPGFYMHAELLDDRIKNFYKKEEKQMGTIGFFAAIAMGLSIMGLLGFVSLNLLKRRKEIGIRKINGAKIRELTRMINIQYTKWLTIAFLIASPIAWYATSWWQENFAYKTSISWWVFALVGFFTLIIILFTISWQSWRAARRNPVEALRYE